jgi:DNA-binding MarR family transcriptional regulator
MTQTTEDKRGRGRPRPLAAIERDAMLLALLRKGPKTRNQICKETGLATSIVYLSLDRLRKRDKVKLCQGPAAERLWSVDVDSPCP